ENTGFTPIKLISSGVFVLTGLGFIAVVSCRGGLVGKYIANPAVYYFDVYAALIVLGGISLISLLVLLEGRISLAPFNALWRAIRSLWHKEDAELPLDASEIAAPLAVPATAEAADEPYIAPAPVRKVAPAAAEAENKQKRAAE